MVKAAKIEKPTVHKAVPQPGHNGPDQETFHIHLGQILKAKAQVNAVAKILKEARRRAVDAGLVLEDLDWNIKNREAEPETVQASIRRRAQYAFWMGLAPGVEPDMFTVAAARENEETVAEHEGYVDGLEGVSAKGDRYDMTNPLGQARMRGWNRGQDVLKERLMQMSADAEAKEKAKGKKAATEPKPEPSEPTGKPTDEVPEIPPALDLRKGKAKPEAVH